MGNSSWFCPLCIQFWSVFHEAPQKFQQNRIKAAQRTGKLDNTSLYRHCFLLCFIPYILPSCSLESHSQVNYLDTRYCHLRLCFQGAQYLNSICYRFCETWVGHQSLLPIFWSNLGYFTVWSFFAMFTTLTDSREYEHWKYFWVYRGFTISFTSDMWNKCPRCSNRIIQIWK